MVIGVDVTGGAVGEDVVAFVKRYGTDGKDVGEDAVEGVVAFVKRYGTDGKDVVDIGGRRVGEDAGKDVGADGSGEVVLFVKRCGISPEVEGAVGSAMEIVDEYFALHLQYFLGGLVGAGRSGLSVGLLGGAKVMRTGVLKGCSASAVTVSRFPPSVVKMLVTGFTSSVVEISVTRFPPSVVLLTGRDVIRRGMKPDLLQFRQWGTKFSSKKPEVNPSMGVLVTEVSSAGDSSPSWSSTSWSGSQQHSPSPSLHSPRSVPAGQEPSIMRMLKLRVSSSSW